MGSNEKKYATLGMPHGTAMHRLRKNVLFFLLKKHEENVCVKCGHGIISVEDLSIEHIKPWEGVSAELFWDLQNVAFSHLHCNRPHRPNGGGGKNKIEAPKGKQWCGNCESFKDDSEFSDGARNQCRVCKSKLNAERVR